MCKAEIRLMKVVHTLGLRGKFAPPFKVEWLSQFLIEGCPFSDNHCGKKSYPYEAILYVDKKGCICFKCYHSECAFRTYKMLEGLIARQNQVKGKEISHVR